MGFSILVKSEAEHLLKYLCPNKRKGKWKAAKPLDWKWWCEVTLKEMAAVEKFECSCHLDCCSPNQRNSPTETQGWEWTWDLMDIKERLKRAMSSDFGGKRRWEGKIPDLLFALWIPLEGPGHNLPGFRDSLASPVFLHQQLAAVRNTHSTPCHWLVTHFEVSRLRRGWAWTLLRGAWESLGWFSLSRFFSWHLCPNCINPWGPGPLAALDPSCHNRPLANYVGTSGLTQELESPS